MLTLFDDMYDRAYVLTPEFEPALDFCKKQQDSLWTSEEIRVDLDKHEMLTGTSEAEKHALLTVLKTFTHYEVRAGSNYWLSTILNTFAPIEIKRMASMFGYVENCVHAPFYNALNEALFINDYAHYTEYLKDPILKKHIETVDDIISDSDLLTSIGSFSLIEGGALYSAFAVLKGFRHNGYNKMGNIANGVNFSERDESLHADAGAWLYHLTKTYGGNTVRGSHCVEHITANAKALLAHEDHIIKLIFEKGSFCGLTEEDTQLWVRERFNKCLANLGIDAISSNNRKSNISKWFGSYSAVRTDFFDAVPMYKRGVAVESFNIQF